MRSIANAVTSRRLAACVVLALAGSASAQTGLTFSLQNNGPGGLGGSQVFQTTRAAKPNPIGGGNGMDLRSFIDDIANLAANESGLRDVEEDFILCFEVDPFSIGQPRGEALFPHNVNTQWMRRQQAGDAFATTEAFSRSNGRVASKSMGIFNNVLAVNQAPPYGESFNIEPNVGPDVFLPPNTQQDQVDASCMIPPGDSPALYFSLALGSPSLQTLAGGVGNGSAAAIFADPDISVGGNEVLYAAPNALGLDVDDQISSLAVWDDDADLSYNGSDTVIFSLLTGSPTLGLLGLGSADLLISEGGTVRLWATANDLGLLATDTIMGIQPETLIGGSALRTLQAKGIPAPAAGVILGLGGVFAARRRRA